MATIIRFPITREKAQRLAKAAVKRAGVRVDPRIALMRAKMEKA